MDEGIGRVEARVRGVSQAGEVGLVLLDVVEAPGAEALGWRVKDQAEDQERPHTRPSRRPGTFRRPTPRLAARSGRMRSWKTGLRPG